jgi:hypothetical protein
MPQRLEPKFDVLPAAQRQIWNALAPAPRLGFVLYGGTAIALHLGHRRSIDFDFFRSEPLDKRQIRGEFAFVKDAVVLQDTPDTLAILAEMPAGLVKISFFGNIGFGRVNDPLLTRDRVLLVASLQDLMATKLKATLDRAEAKDYRDIAAMISTGVSLSQRLQIAFWWRAGTSLARHRLFQGWRPKYSQPGRSAASANGSGCGRRIAERPPGISIIVGTPGLKSLAAVRAYDTQKHLLAGGRASDRVFIRWMVLRIWREFSEMKFGSARRYRRRLA